jgi:CrcB protein
VIAFLLVGVGGALGSMARYGIGLVLPSSAGFPFATLAVNVIGCFCIGLAMPALARVGPLPLELRLFVIVGFLGGFTTFSAFGIETVSLLRSGVGVALVNIAANVGLGLAAVVVGRAIVS